MEKENLIITVSGRCASGKSRMLLLLKRFLRDQGFEVEFGGGNKDFPTESEFDKHESIHFDKVIEAMKQTRKITIKEQQLANKIHRT